MIPLVMRELRLAIRHPADTLSAVMFFVLVAALFPFGVGPSPELLARLAPGVLLAAALLAALLPLDRLFGAEAEDGDVVLLAPAAASFDQYPNFEKRGEDFAALVAALIG